jgi:hypothetical protein
MALASKVALIVFLLFLVGAALVSGQSRSSVGIAQVDQDQEKLCLTCHSPRFPPNDTSQDHWIYGYDIHEEGSPCYACHGDSLDVNGEPTHNSEDIAHPTVDEAAAMGKSEITCNSCHYPFNLQEELQAGSIMAPTPSNEPTFAAWALMLISGISLIAGVSIIGVLFSTRKHKSAGGN